MENGSKGEMVAVAVVFGVMLLAVLLGLRWCYGWCCDRLAESLSRVNGGDNHVVVSDCRIVAGDVLGLAGCEAHGAAEDVASAVHGARLDAKDEAGARGTVDDHDSDRAHGVAEHVYLVLRLEPALPKKESENGDKKSGKKIHGGDYSTNGKE